MDESFGFERGRYLARLPDRSQWERAVADACGCAEKRSELTPVKRKSIVEKYARRLAATMSGPERAYLNGESWPVNAIRSHRSHPMRLAICGSSDTTDDPIRCIDEIDDDDPNWHVNRTVCIPKQADEFSRWLKPIIEMGTELHIVDPVFRPSHEQNGKRCDSRWIPTLEKLLAIAAGTARIRVVHLHVKKRQARDGQTDAQFQAECCARLTRLLTRGQSIQVHMWWGRKNGERLHDRFLLTNICGVSVSGGFDEGASAATTTLALLSDKEFRLRFDQYARGNGFDLIREFKVR